MNQIEILNKIQNKLKELKDEYQPLKYYYIYLIFFSNNNFYIGSRISNSIPENDVNYNGSYKNSSEIGTKLILKTFSNENEMIFYETNLIEKFKNHPNCININSTPRTCSDNNTVENLFNTKHFLTTYGVSSPTTLTNWCKLLGIKKIKKGRWFYITKKDKDKLDELSRYIKSGYTYEKYLIEKGVCSEDIKCILQKIRGIN